MRRPCRSRPDILRTSSAIDTEVRMLRSSSTSAIVAISSCSLMRVRPYPAPGTGFWRTNWVQNVAQILDQLQCRSVKHANAVDCMPRAAVISGLPHLNRFKRILKFFKSINNLKSIDLFWFSPLAPSDSDPCRGATSTVRRHTATTGSWHGRSRHTATRPSGWQRPRLRPT